MTPAPSPPITPRRLFLHEPGWKVAQKPDSAREFCYAMAPGQDFYHRLLEGELYLYNNEERLCVACAERRGLLSYEPKGLRPPAHALEVDAPRDGSEFDVRDPETL